MLRNLLLGGTSPLFYRSPENEGGADTNPQDEALHDATQQDAAAETAANAEAEAAAVVAAAPAEASVPKWKDKQIDRMRGRLGGLEKEIAERTAREAEITAENERLRALVEAANRRPPAADGTVTPPAEIPPVRSAAPARPAASDDDRIRAAAATMVAQQTAEQQMEAAVAKGKQDHGAKWDAALENLRTLGGFDQETLIGILATDDPAKVLFELGNAPTDGAEPAYVRIMGLPPAKRLYELGKLSAAAPAAPAPKKISDAAAPVDPIVQGGTAVREKPIDLYDQKFTEPPDGRTWPDGMKGDSADNDAKWFAMREAQKKASKGRPWSPRA